MREYTKKIDAPVRVFKISTVTRKQQIKIVSRSNEKNKCKKVEKIRLVPRISVKIRVNVKNSSTQLSKRCHFPQKYKLTEEKRRKKTN